MSHANFDNTIVSHSHIEKTVTYLMLLSEILIRVTFSIETKLYTCLKSFNLLGFFQCKSGILWCWQNFYVAC